MWRSEFKVWCKERFPSYAREQVSATYSEILCTSLFYPSVFERLSLLEALVAARCDGPKSEGSRVSEGRGGMRDTLHVRSHILLYISVHVLLYVIFSQHGAGAGAGERRVTH